ncbi:SCAN box domain-containing protein [Nephila pilipes]|uniref:SCAN box domain-containing protein n=1 Tax=Nephila pilipes TaxID=299642 RepID=A0A8X6TPA6_NEPPI|nr:SCAN box domain-containing protein [Nephila pilipes]
MKKLELSRVNPDQKNESENRFEPSHKILQRHILSKYNQKHDEMGLYLINFERRSKMAQVPKKYWVVYLLIVLPTVLSNMLASEAPDNANNYDFVESLNLQRLV